MNTSSMTPQQRQTQQQLKRIEADAQARNEGRQVLISRKQHDELLDANPTILRQALKDPNGRSWSLAGITITFNAPADADAMRTAISQLQSGGAL